MANKPAQPVSTQAHLPLVGIEQGVVILHDGSYRAVLQATSINFMLKSEQEQNSLIQAYQSFLNSLNTHIQIVMQSRHLDLEPYLKKLEASIVDQHNELIRQQTEDYIAYVRDLIGVANIMDKRFFVVVPYTPLTAIKHGLMPNFLSRGKKGAIKINQSEFTKHREELMQRASIVASGLSSMGIRSQILDTDDVVKMLYSVYNADIASEERLNEPQALTGNVVSVAPPEKENSAPGSPQQSQEPTLNQPLPDVQPLPKDTNGIPA